ncbi:MAG: leucine-rich repeat protein, partial [Christensenellaceae bacterium]
KRESGELVYDGAIGCLEEATFAYGGGKPKEVGESAFAYASDLRCATFADSFAVIGANAFYGSGLFSVSIGKGVTSIGEGAFSACHNLTKFSVSQENPCFASEDGVLFGVDGEDAVLLCFPSGYRGDYTLPAFVNIGGKSRKVTRIATSAIVCAHELTRFSLPTGVTVGENNFIDCPKAVVV